MQKKTVEKIAFENIGGSFQFRAKSVADLKKILSLDETVWAALCVPAASLNGDPAFFKALDGDADGMIRADEVKKAIIWMLNILKDINAVDASRSAIPVSALNPDFPDGKQLIDFFTANQNELDNGSGMVELSSIRAKFAAVSTGALTGDGMLRSKAVENSPALPLYSDLTALLGCQDKLTLDILEKFLSDAANFVQWSDTAEKPLFRNDDPVKYYDTFKSVQEKIDEYFRFCELLRIDPAHASRFELDPAKLPELDLLDSAKVDSVLAAAPLNRPDAGNILNLAEIKNPFFKEKIAAFSELFKITELSAEAWHELKAEFAPYAAYLAKAHGDTAGQLGREKLEKYLAGNEADLLREFFARDKALGGVMDSLKKFERLLLFNINLLNFVNNFVSFAAFFTPGALSMLQAGRLVMDGKSYRLAVWIDDVAAHKKIASLSNMCLLYLEVISSGANPVKRKLAVAVTAGSLNRIYIGKPAFFTDCHNVVYTGKIVDMVEGPISFRQTLFAPFRRLGEAISGKLQKLTDFSNTEKQLLSTIDKGQLPPKPAAPQPPTASGPQKFLGNGAMMMLAGGLSVAAVGAGLSVIFKSIASAISAISALPFHVILIWIVVFAAMFLVPMSIFAWLRLKKRNLTLFLEAGGWAVNLPMRLNISVSRLFTHTASYPRNSRFIKIKSNLKPLLWLLFFALLAATAAILLARYGKI